MAETFDQGGDEAFEAVERRLFRLTCLAVALMVAFSLPISPWRVTAGLLVGGILSLFNYRWLKSSIIAAFQVGEAGAASQRGRFSLQRYVLRYVIIGFVIFILHRLDLISLVAALFGLCSFVAALLVEALWQIVRMIINREEL